VRQCDQLHGSRFLSPRATGDSEPKYPLIERWNGTSWSYNSVASPTWMPSSSYRLEGVSCFSATSCMAVGYATSGADSIFAERLSGSTWTLQDVTAPLGTYEAQLKGVSCPSANACLAVGAYRDSLLNWHGLTECFLQSSGGDNQRGHRCRRYWGDPEWSRESKRLRSQILVRIRPLKLLRHQNHRSERRFWNQ